ncbi:MAG: tRNA (adenosine(37)-N6)-dimethylallyltransferase MiaA [Vampirovibrionales bacterium]
MSFHPAPVTTAVHPAERSRPLRPIIIITGPTATGKTAVGVALAKQLNGEVINADSQLVYRGLNIGTATPTPEEREGIVHHVMDVALPNEAFSAGQYQQHATAALLECYQRGKTPIFVGGTGFYLRSLFEPMALANVATHPELRQQLEAEIAQQGLAGVFQRLQQLDPIRASQLMPTDAQRIVRALEINLLTGQPVPQTPQPSWVSQQFPSGVMPPVYWFALGFRDKAHHWELIAQRIDTMLADGWLEEVATLVQTYGADAHALQVAHGYPVLQQVLQGTLNLHKAKEVIAIQVRQYARRQRVWLQKVQAPQGVQWLYRDELPTTASVIDAILQQCV